MSVRAELEEIRSQQRVLAERASRLLKLLSFPYVDPVLVYNRYGARHEVPAEASCLDEDSPLRDAFDDLRAWDEDDYCAPIGVSVGGALIPYDELARRFLGLTPPPPSPPPAPEPPMIEYIRVPRRTQ